MILNVFKHYLTLPDNPTVYQHGNGPPLPESHPHCLAVLWRTPKQHLWPACRATSHDNADCFAVLGIIQSPATEHQQWRSSCGDAKQQLGTVAVQRIIVLHAPLVRAGNADAWQHFARHGQLPHVERAGPGPLWQGDSVAVQEHGRVLCH